MNNVVLRGKMGAGFNDDRYTLPKDGNPGDILVKTEMGSAWQKQDPAEMLPKDGNPGDILVKTEMGSAWESFVEGMIEEDMLPAVKIGSDILGIKNDILMM